MPPLTESIPTNLSSSSLELHSEKSSKYCAAKLNSTRILIRPEYTKLHSCGVHKPPATTDRFHYFRLRCVRSWRHATRSARTALLLTVLAVFMHLTSLLSSKWEFKQNEYGQGYSGLWRVCILEKCDVFIHQLVYVWFHIVQACMLVSFLTLLSCSTLSAIYLMSRVRHVIRPTLITAAIINSATTAFLCACAVVIYGVDQGEDPSSLSWGYGLAVISMATELAITVLLVYERRYVRVTRGTLQFEGSTEMLAHFEASPMSSEENLTVCSPLRGKLLRAESVPAHHSSEDDVFCETEPLKSFEVLNRVNSYAIVPDPPRAGGRARAVSFNLIRDRSDSINTVPDVYSRSYNMGEPQKNVWE